MSEAQIDQHPFHVDNFKKLAESNNSDSYEVQIGDSFYIIKDILNPSFSLENFPGDTLEKKAVSMKLFFSVLKEHLGEYAWDTYFVIGKNTQGEKAIKVVQKKVDGFRLDEVDLEGQEEVFQDIKNVIMGKLEEAFADPRLTKMDFRAAIDWVRQDALFEKNVFITKENQVVLVDLF